MDRPEAALFRALSYIESHLDEELSLDRVAGTAYYSPYHFHRLFRRFTGQSLAEYIRRLRLESASVLLRSGRGVTETALASGYWTHEAFTRAFRRRFGRSPRQFAAEELPEGASDRFLDRPRRTTTTAIEGWKRRILGPYTKAILPGNPGSPWPPEAKRCLGISWDDPSVTRPESIRYDVFWTGEKPVTTERGENPPIQTQEHQDSEITPGRIEGGPALAALHKGSFDDLTASYHYLLFMAPRPWGLRIHPVHPPYEEFLPEGILITVPLA